jgi:hypothetical protein
MRVEQRAERLAGAMPARFDHRRVGAEYLGRLFRG